MDVKIIKEIEALLKKCADNGSLRNDINFESASLLVYSAFVFAFMGFMVMPGMGREKLSLLLEDQINLIIQGLGV